MQKLWKLERSWSALLFLRALQKTDLCFLIESGEVVCTTHQGLDQHGETKEGEILQGYA